jgi:hypothetical protein
MDLDELGVDNAAGSGDCSFSRRLIESVNMQHFHKMLHS